MSWMQTYSGKVFSLPPTPDMFCMEDIAHSLAHTCRYNGHSPKFYSVAEHCVAMAERALQSDRPDLARVALMHDAAEAYTGDMPKPLKPHLPDFRALEADVEAAIEEWLGWSIRDPRVKEWDTRILIDERDQLFKSWPREWGLDVEPLGVKIYGFLPTYASELFLAMARELEVAGG